MQSILESLTIAQLLAICKSAANIFTTASLPIGDQKQSFDAYIQNLSATTGMPRSLCRANAEKNPPRTG